MDEQNEEKDIYKKILVRNKGDRPLVGKYMSVFTEISEPLKEYTGGTLLGHCLFGCGNDLYEMIKVAAVEGICNNGVPCSSFGRLCF